MVYLTGIDVSRYQSSTPPLAGLAFLIARAGYGSGNPADSRYALHAANARAAGVALGAYWYWYDGQNNDVAVAQFLEIAADADFLALDLEGVNHATASGQASARDFIALVHAAGRPIGLYASLSGFPQLGQDWNWVAYWESVEPPIAWTFWQYGSTVLDHDKFRGDAAALAAFVASQGGDMAAKPITDLTPKLIDWPASTPYYALDGTTKMGTANAVTGRYSPFGAGSQRAFYAGSAPNAKLALVTPSKVGAIPPSFTQDDLDRAKAAGYAEAKAKAATAVQAI